jgi:hypothetical protein
MPFVYDRDAQGLLLASLTPDRLTAYMAATKGDVHQALHLYEYNTRISEALFGVIQGLEIAFRNGCHGRISANLKCATWYERAGVLDEKELGSVGEAKRNLIRWRKRITPGRVISELTFGFWIRLIAPSYEKRLWVPHLHKAMPLMPGPDRATAFDRMEYIRKLRNRIAHHEPIFQRDITADYEILIETLSWICPVTTSWVHSTNSFTHRYYV